MPADIPFNNARRDLPVLLLVQTGAHLIQRLFNPGQVMVRQVMNRDTLIGFRVRAALICVPDLVTEGDYKAREAFETWVNEAVRTRLAEECQGNIAYL